MAVGAQVTKAGIDATAEQIAKQLYAAFNNIQRFQEYLVATPDADLIAIGFTQNDVDVLRSSMSDLETLRGIFNGKQTLATAQDFKRFSKRLLGIGLY